MTLDQVYDELYGEIDQIKNELKNTLAQIQYASNFTEGVPLGTLSVGSESSQVIAPHVALLPGAESGMMLLDLPVGTESGQIVRPEVQNDANAESLVPEALLTGRTVESYLNSKLIAFVTTYNSTDSCFPIPDGYPKPRNNEHLVCAARNRETGSIYLLWFNNGKPGFVVASIVVGAAPTEGQSVYIQYLA